MRVHSSKSFKIEEMTGSTKFSILLQGKPASESQRYAARRLVEHVASLPGVGHIEPVSSVDALEGAADFVFVYSRNPDALAAAAAKARVGAFEVRHVGAPLAAIADLAVPEVIGRLPA